MPHDGRHLRARWTIAAIGWLLWLIFLFLPRLTVGHNPWPIYADALRALRRHEFQFRNTEDILDRAALYGFVLASLVFLVSPLLVHLNRSHNARTRRWRWLGVGLSGMAQLTVMLIHRSAAASAWRPHLLVLSHLIVCIAILPWPGERSSSAAFEVILPVPSTADPTANKPQTPT